MRLIKFALISFVFLFGIITLISLLFPSRIRVSKAINLSHNRAAVFSLLKKDTLWHPAYADSNAMKNMQGVTKQVMEETDSTYIIKMQVADKKPVISGWQLYGGGNNNSLTLQWYMDFQFAWYPWEKFTSLFYDKSYGVMMERGLDSLKKRLDK